MLNILKMLDILRALHKTGTCPVVVFSCRGRMSGRHKHRGPKHNAVLNTQCTTSTGSKHNAVLNTMPPFQYCSVPSLRCTQALTQIIIIINIIVIKIITINIIIMSIIIIIIISAQKVSPIWGRVISTFVVSKCHTWVWRHGTRLAEGDDYKYKYKYKYKYRYKYKYT